MDKIKIILSGGGTGGHIYPAVAVAEALQRRLGDGVELLFVGAEGKMEMEKIPALGYRIEGLPVAGLQRRLTARNLSLPFKVAASLRKARRVIRSFGADVVVGFGGYASAPVLWSAQRMGIPTLIQEQNSYAGVTNKLLASRARRICVAYEGMERFFPKERIVMTGNPLRGRFAEGADPAARKAEALVYFGLEADKPVVLVVGGSLGTRTLNNMMKANVERITAEGRLQVIWQTGKFYEREMTEFMQGRSSEGIWRGAFIDRMDLAYAAADVVVGAFRGRNGVGTVPDRKAGDFRAVAQCGRRPPDQECAGPRGEGCGAAGARRRGGFGAFPGGRCVVGRPGADAAHGRQYPRAGHRGLCRTDRRRDRGGGAEKLNRDPNVRKLSAGYLSQVCRLCSVRQEDSGRG